MVPSRTLLICFYLAFTWNMAVAQLFDKAFAKGELDTVTVRGKFLIARATGTDCVRVRADKVTNPTPPPPANPCVINPDPLELTLLGKPVTLLGGKGDVDFTKPTPVGGVGYSLSIPGARQLVTADANVDYILKGLYDQGIYDANSFYAPVPALVTPVEALALARDPIELHGAFPGYISFDATLSDLGIAVPSTSVGAFVADFTFDGKELFSCEFLGLSSGTPEIYYHSIRGPLFDAEMRRLIKDDVAFSSGIYTFFEPINIFPAYQIYASAGDHVLSGGFETLLLSDPSATSASMYSTSETVGWPSLLISEDDPLKLRLLQ